MHQPLMFLATAAVQICSAAVFSVGMAGTVVEDFQLHAWSVEIMSSAAVIGGGATLIYARWQSAQLKAAKEWQQFNATALAPRVKELEGKLKEAAGESDKLREELGVVRGRADQLRSENLELVKHLAELSARLEGLVRIPEPPAPAPALVEGQAS